MKKLTFFLVVLLAIVMVITACNDDKSPVDTGTGATQTTAPVDGTTEPTKPVCAHVEGEWIVDSDATCTKDGARHTVCTLCGETVKSEVIPAAHLMSDWIVDKTAAADREGKKHCECLVCGEVLKNETVSKLTPSKGLIFASNGDGTCAVTHIGKCTDKDVVIPSLSPDGDKVTAIAEKAFLGSTAMESVAIPDSVTSIGQKAFAYCATLDTVALGSGVTVFENEIFQECNDITSIVFPEGVTTIGMRVFNGCNKLASVTIPKSMTEIKRMAFNDCNRLVEIVNNSSLEITAGKIGNGGIALVAKDVHDGASKIRGLDGYLFLSCGGTNYLIDYVGDKTELTLPDSYKGESYEIFNYAFYWNIKLTSVTVPDAVTKIGDGAFERCMGLESITMPQGLTGIGANAFAWCTGLASITIPEGVTAIGDSAFEDCHHIESVVIPEGVVSIGQRAFWHCVSLNKLSIPTTLTDMGGYAFCGCDKLEEIYITDLVAWCNMTFGEDSIDPFTGSYKLYLNDKQVTELVIPDGVKSLPDFVFLGCTELKSVTISKDVKVIGKEAFFHCINLTDVYYEGSEADWKKITMGESNECLTNANIHYNCK